jgi:GTPase subunit of restriction endonuclease
MYVTSCDMGMLYNNDIKLMGDAKLDNVEENSKLIVREDYLKFRNLLKYFVHILTVNSDKRNVQVMMQEKYPDMDPKWKGSIEDADEPIVQEYLTKIGRPIEEKKASESWNGKGQDGGSIRKDYLKYREYSTGTIDVKIAGGFQVHSRGSYINWINSRCNIVATWNHDKNEVVGLRMYLSDVDDEDQPRYDLIKLTDLGIYDSNDTEPTEVLKKFFRDYTTFLKEHPVVKEEKNMPNTSSRVKSLIEKLESSKNIILHGAPGTGKTYIARQVAAQMIGIDESELSASPQYSFVQFHPSYDYTDFVEGLRPIINDDGSMSFELKDGVFKRFCETAYQADSDKKFVFVIDEINRGEISKIFGELFFSVDPGYRDKKYGINTQYSNLHSNNEKFFIPNNVYIIGTMNDIDRSVDTFDFAMRRRFRFINVTAAESMDMWDDSELSDDDKEQAKKRLTALNQVIENIDGLNSDYDIGASYFMKLAELGKDKYEVLWNDFLEPLLSEYLRGTANETENMIALEKAYKNDKTEETIDHKEVE